ncbi:MAG: AAA family ATPase [Eggerthellaceae bacterium]|nr:AAA family ATPase [Eggerthellaceae bacterium]
MDKTGIIGLVNDVIDTTRCMVCVSRPRRFGKSFAAKAVAAYYCWGCDSRALFERLEVSRHPSFEEHLNAYNVIQLDMTEFTGLVGSEVVPEVSRLLARELRSEFPEVQEGGSLTEMLLDTVKLTGRKFVFVIDEWDAVFRETEHEAAAQERYVKFLRLLFKNLSFTDKAVAAAYITGILPIKRYGTQSALTDFEEFTMVDPSYYAPYVGFTESEVKQLADECDIEMNVLRRWYDGYEFPRTGHVYAPFSVMRACMRRQVGAYWTSSETFELLRTYIDLDFEGLQGDIVRAVGGEALKVDPYTFQNDMASINSRDDVLTLLVHLGYLAYDNETRLARVPNEEVREEFERALKGSRHAEVARIVRESDQLLAAILSGDAAAVADSIGRSHDATCSPIHYNGEQSLRSVVRAALISAADDYVRVEELPSGHGLADIVYLPRRGSDKPALLVELKWDKPVESAIDQIHARDYPAILRDLDMPILLVGVAYDADTKEHSCIIERA